MDTSLNPCLCKDLYGYLMKLCLGLSFSYMLVRNSPTSNFMLYEIMHHSKMIMITCVMKVKENTRIILLYESAKYS